MLSSARAMRGQAARSSWAAPVYHPVPLAAALLLAINDHWLKGAGVVPAAVTGKLSDLAGLFFFPALCWALLRGLRVAVGRPLPAPRWWIAAIVLTTAAGFVAINLSPVFNEWIGRWWCAKVMDASDLWALGALLPAWLWMERVDGQERRCEVRA